MLILIVIKGVLKVMKVLTQKSIKITFLVVLLTKLFPLMISLLSQLLFIEVQMLLTYEFSKAILKEYEYCRKVMNKHFNKNLIMSEEEEHLFQ